MSCSSTPALRMISTRFYFRESSEKSISCFQIIRRLGYAGPWHSDGHIQRASLVQCRHESHANLREVNSTQAKQGQAHKADHLPLEIP